MKQKLYKWHKVEGDDVLNLENKNVEFSVIKYYRTYSVYMNDLEIGKYFDKLSEAKEYAGKIADAILDD